MPSWEKSHDRHSTQTKGPALTGPGNFEPQEGSPMILRLRTLVNKGLKATWKGLIAAWNWLDEKLDGAEL